MIRIHSLQPPTAKESELEFVPVDPAYGNPPQCPACHGIVAMKTWLPPHTATLEFAAGPCRLASPMTYPHIYIRPGNYAVVSSTLIDHYKHLHMRGITSFAPIRIEQIQHLSEFFNGPLPTFFHVSIERLNYALDLATSKLSTKAVAACPRCLGATYRPANRLALQRGSWQGQAIFHVDAVPGRTFITDEFCLLLKQLQGWNYRIARTDILTV